MVIQQQYYTSCRTETRTGYQIKAESPNFESEKRQILNRLIGYSIPSGVDVKAINTHPIALRYFVNEEDAFLVCSQSSGQDEFGRDGNFFAHSLVGTVTEISTIPSIFSWKSPFWVKQDKSSQTALPTLNEFNHEITFNFDSVWTFLKDKKRQEWFYKLICAVIDYEQSKRKIIIIDDNEAITYWIASLSTILHPRYVNYLTFATYHHDPYTAPFMITGTTENSNFRCSNDEYYSYFILNVPQQKVSDVPESDLAIYLLENLDEQKYESQILEFYEWLDRYSSDSKYLSKHLDYYINFQRAIKGEIDALPFAKVIESAQVIIQEQSQKNSHSQYVQQDLEDLSWASYLLGKALINQEQSDLLTSYINALKMLKKIDSYFLNQADKAIFIFVSLVLNKQEQKSMTLWTALESLYSPALLKEHLNSLDFIQQFTQQLRSNDSEQLLIFWKQIGKELTLSSSNQQNLSIILAKTFSAIPEQELSKRLRIPVSASTWIKVFLENAKLSKDFILDNALLYKQKYPNSPVFEWIYYALLQPFSFDQRPKYFWTYWQKSSSLIPELHNYELQRDILQSHSTSQAIDVIYLWLDYLAQKYHKSKVKEALEFIWTQPQFERQELAETLLQKDKSGSIFEIDIYNQLIQDLLSTLQLNTPTESLANIYTRVLANPNLSISQEQTLILQGSLDMYHNRISEMNIEASNQRYQTLPPEKYEEEVEKLLEKFFAQKTPEKLTEEHFKVVQIAYVIRHRDLFWDIYWSNFCHCLVEEQRVNDIVLIMDLWFNVSSHLAEKLGYFVPEFFINLPNALEEVFKNKGFGKVKKEFESKIKRKSWYPIIQPIFENTRSNIMGKISNFFS